MLSAANAYVKLKVENLYFCALLSNLDNFHMQLFMLCLTWVSLFRRAYARITVNPLDSYSGLFFIDKSVSKYGL